MTDASNYCIFIVLSDDLDCTKERPRKRPPGGRVDLLIEKQQRNSTMKQRLSAFGAVGTVLTALILSLPAMAGESVPFKGRSGGVVTNLGFDPVRNIVYLHQAGKGHATHLGSFTLEGDVEVDRNRSRESDICTHSG